MRIVGTPGGGSSGTVVGVGNRVTAVGASQVDRHGEAGIIEGDGFMHYVWFGANALGRWQYHPQEAEGATPLTTTRDTYLPNFDTHIALYGSMPSLCVIQAGRNDMNGSVATALGVYEQIVDGLITRGILPIITGLFVSSATTQMANTYAYNVGLALMAQKKGLTFINPNPLLVDGTTGSFKSGYAADGQHVDPIAAKLAGEYIAAKMALGGVAPYWDVPLAYTNDSNTAAALKLTNPLLLTDTNTDGTPDNWTETDAASEMTVALEDATADGVLGNWMTLTKAATTGDRQVQATISSPTVGNWYAVGFAYKWDYDSGSDSSIRAEIRTSGGTNLFRIQVMADEDLGVVKAWNVFKVPSGTTALQFRVLMNAIGTFSFGQPTVLDLTALGIDGWI